MSDVQQEYVSKVSPEELARVEADLLSKKAALQGATVTRLPEPVLGNEELSQIVGDLLARLDYLGNKHEALEKRHLLLAKVVSDYGFSLGVFKPSIWKRMKMRIVSWLSE